MEYDLQTTEAMFAGGRWLYVVFMCQQALKKLVKGLYLLYIDDNIPKSYDIPGLFSHFIDKLPQPFDDDHITTFRRLSAFYLETRYPEYKERLSGITTKETAQTLLKKSKEAFTWLLTLKP